MKETEAKILIVDDDEGCRILLSHLLRREGFNVLTSPDGNTALNAIRMESPDVLLLDYKMEGMDGMEVLKLAKGMDPDLPVVMITGFANIPGAIEAIKAGAHDYLAKPFEHNEVIRIIRRALAETETETTDHGAFSARAGRREAEGKDGTQRCHDARYLGRKSRGAF